MTSEERIKELEESSKKLEQRLYMQEQLNRVIMRARGLRVPLEKGDVLQISVNEGVTQEEALQVIADLRRLGVTAPVLLTDGGLTLQRLTPPQIRDTIRTLERMLAPERD